MPEGADRQRKDPFVQCERPRARVENSTREEAAPDPVSEPLQVASITGIGQSGGLDLDGDDVTSAELGERVGCRSMPAALTHSASK